MNGKWEGCIRATYNVLGKEGEGGTGGEGKGRRTSVNHHVHGGAREKGGVAGGQGLCD